LQEQQEHQGGREVTCATELAGAMDGKERRARRHRRREATCATEPAGAMDASERRARKLCRREASTSGVEQVRQKSSGRPPVDDEYSEKERINIRALKAFIAAQPVDGGGTAPDHSMLEAHVDFQGLGLPFSISPETTLGELAVMYEKWALVLGSAT